jgi:hypothetical protein
MLYFKAFHSINSFNKNLASKKATGKNHRRISYHTPDQLIHQKWHQAVGLTASYHIGRDVGLISINKAGDHRAGLIELRNGSQLVLVEETLHQSAIDLLPNAPILTRQ